MIGRNSARCATVPQGSYDPYSGRPYGQQSAPYYGDNSGLEGGPYRESSYYGEPRRAADCRMGQVITRDPYGREVYEDVEMCRGSDGVWRTRY